MSQQNTMKLYGLTQIDQIPGIDRVSEEDRFSMKVVSHVLPFRVNNYVLEQLIDWDNVPNDPMYQLVFMQKDMLDREDYEELAEVLRVEKPDPALVKETVRKIRYKMNPHPAGQLEKNVPMLEGDRVPGVQHKYKQTALLFPSQGQTCFSYCTFCFRWAQFVGEKDLKFATDQALSFQNYLREHKEISDVLITGGDPMIMKAKVMAKYIEPLLGQGFEHIQNIRIGSKVFGYWPYRFTTDADAGEMLDLFKRVNESGKHLALMAHFNHWKELSTDAVKESIAKVRATGTQIRAQSPVLRHINDDPKVWSRMWNEQVKLGIIPYYMFVERDTGPRGYFEIPLERALDIYRGAIQGVSGLARTARGPSMSADPGKVCIEGITEIAGEKVFALSFLQGRNGDWIKRPFFAKYDASARWLTDLKPAFGQDQFFFEEPSAVTRIVGLKTQIGLETEAVEAQS